MDWASIAGVVIALIGIAIGQTMEGGKLSSLVQPAAFAIVVVGTFGAVLLQSKLRTMGFFVTVDGVEQPDHAGLHQIIDLYAGRQFCLHVVGKTLDQRHVLRQQGVLVRFPFDRVHSLLFYFQALK